MGFPDGSVIKNPSAMQEMQEMWVWSLGQEEPLGKEMATPSNILAWENRMDKPRGLQSMRVQSWTPLSMHAHKRKPSMLKKI